METIDYSAFIKQQEAIEAKVVQIINLHDSILIDFLYRPGDNYRNAQNTVHALVVDGYETFTYDESNITFECVKCIRDDDDYTASYRIIAEEINKPLSFFEDKFKQQLVELKDKQKIIDEKKLQQEADELKEQKAEYYRLKEIFEPTDK